MCRLQLFAFDTDINFWIKLVKYRQLLTKAQTCFAVGWTFCQNKFNVDIWRNLCHFVEAVYVGVGTNVIATTSITFTYIFLPTDVLCLSVCLSHSWTTFNSGLRYHNAIGNLVQLRDSILFTSRKSYMGFRLVYKNQNDHHICMYHIEVQGTNR